MYYIYDTSTSEILFKPNSHQRARYKTRGAARAALNRMHRHHLEKIAAQDEWNRKHFPILEKHSPLYTAAIAESSHYHAHIEQFETVYSMFDHEQQRPIRQSVNTPHYLDPSSETYWSS